MACLRKMNVDHNWSCQRNIASGALGRYEEAILVNASDIESFSGGGANATLVLASGAKGAVIEVVNNGFKVSVARKGGDIYPVMYDPSITMKIPNAWFSDSEGMAGLLAHTSLAIALKGSNGYTIIGLGAPLTCTEIEGDSTTGEYLTFTFGTDEGQTGSTIYGISKATYDALRVPAPKVPAV